MRSWERRKQELLLVTGVSCSESTASLSRQVLFARARAHSQGHSAACGSFHFHSRWVHEPRLPDWHSKGRWQTQLFSERAHTHTDTPKKAHRAHTHTLSSTSCIMHRSLTTSNYLNSHNLRGFFFFHRLFSRRAQSAKRAIFSFFFCKWGCSPSWRQRARERTEREEGLCHSENWQGGFAHSHPGLTAQSVPRQFEASFAPSGPSTWRAFFFEKCEKNQLRLKTC